MITKPEMIQCEFTRDELKLLLMAVNCYKEEHPESTALTVLDNIYDEGMLDYLQEMALSA